MTSNYITTPIFYVNDVPHIGHAYSETAADVLARWSRQRGIPTRLVAGTDEHGEKILRSAVANGVTPKEWVDRLVENDWKPLLRTLDISADDFIRTTDERHKEAVRAFLVQLHDDGHIYESEYKGHYCIGCEEYKLPGEYEVVDGVALCLIHGRPLEYLTETNYFFRMSAFADQLLERYTSDPRTLQPDSVRHEILAFLSSGVRDISITRSSFDWGVEVPWDPAHVVYVWFDALINYISNIGWNADPAEFEQWWPATHIVGKDIARLHSVLWPSMLLAAGLPLPKTIFGHGWLLVNGEKMSKTKKTGIVAQDIIELFGTDAFRYYFMRTIRFGQDGSFSWEDIAARYNSDLANGIGNLASRIISMIEKYRGGTVEVGSTASASAQSWIDRIESALDAADAAIDKLQISEAVAAAWTLVDGLNQYISEVKPWTIAADPERGDELDAVLRELLWVLATIALLLYPVMPSSMEALWSRLGLAERFGAVAGVVPREFVGSADLGAVRVTAGVPLFPRVELPERDDR